VALCQKNSMASLVTADAAAGSAKINFFFVVFYFLKNFKVPPT